MFITIFDLSLLSVRNKRIVWAGIMISRFIEVGYKRVSHLHKDVIEGIKRYLARRQYLKELERLK